MAIALDVSKGRADVAIINQSGTVLNGSGGYDDTRAGHDRLSEVLRDLRRQHPNARLIADVEATGGYERSWVAFFSTRTAGWTISDPKDGDRPCRHRFRVGQDDLKRSTSTAYYPDGVTTVPNAAA